MIKDPSTGESRGFAFITFEDARDAKDAIAALDGYFFLQDGVDFM